MTIDNHGEEPGPGHTPKERDGTRLALVEQLAQCLRRLDQLGAATAAAYVDAAIHELLGGLGPHPSPSPSPLDGD